MARDFFSHGQCFIFFIFTFVLMQNTVVSASVNSTSHVAGSSVVINFSGDQSFQPVNGSHSHSEAGKSHSRRKRGIMELAGMISCVTGCDAIMYKGYGCYCGYSGVGMPVDAIDR